jgi:hypothetical protein
MQHRFAPPAHMPPAAAFATTPIRTTAIPANIRHTIFALGIIAVVLLKASSGRLEDRVQHLATPLAVAMTKDGASREATLTNAPSAPVSSQLHRLEQLQTRRWNASAANFFVLGQKASRDFGVYTWAFSVNGFRVVSPHAGYALISPGSPSVPPVPGAGALLCHSLFLSNCVRWATVSKADTDNSTLREGRMYPRLRGMKFNRVAGVRQVLSTKDGLCQTLHRSGLAVESLWIFGFPCWVLPADSALLSGHLVSRTGSDRFIVKPARGSQGQGIKVFNTSFIQRRLLNPNILNLIKVPIVVQPYLAHPLLHRGRKWDMRTYVIATSVLPMRLYLFSEAIVRYAAATTYSSNSTDSGAVLTNTFVGKMLLQRGVSSITGSLADLCSGEGGGVGSGILADDEPGASPSVHECSSRLFRSMREAIGRLFLAAEPRLKRVYRDRYDRHGVSSSSDEGEGGHGSPFRCAECYHLFGVDLIADSKGRMHVIEVNVAPDLSLSTTGAACKSGGNCADGSIAYDHTKLAAAYNTVRLVYSRTSVASELQRVLARHASEIAPLDLLLMPPTDTDVPVPTLKPDVAEYLLDAMRERRESGCFTPVYPNKVNLAAHGQQLEQMARGLPSCAPPELANTSSDVLPTACGTDAGEMLRAAQDYMRRRVQMHTLLGIVLPDLDGEGSSESPFRGRCEEMLRHVATNHSGTEHSAWAKRSHIFKQVWDLDP